MSFCQIQFIASQLEKQAEEGKLTLEIFFQTPKCLSIARQNHTHLTNFLIGHMKDFIEIAIGDNIAAPQQVVNMTMELLLFPSVIFSGYLVKNIEIDKNNQNNELRILINHIISKMMNQKEINIFFINAIKVLIFIINCTHGYILLLIDDPLFFINQILTLNNSMILDDLMIAIFSQEQAFKIFYSRFDAPLLIENLLKSPEYSSTYFRIVTFFNKILKIFEYDTDRVIKYLETKPICESLVTIGLKFSCLNGLNTINYILGKDSLTMDVNKDKLNGLLAIIDQTINYFLSLITESKMNNCYLFGPPQRESLSIITKYIKLGQWPIQKVSWIFDLAAFLWDKFLSNTTNSFLHNSFYEYFCEITRYEECFIIFINNQNFLQIIPDIFSKKNEIHASFFGHLLKISEIIIDKGSNKFVCPSEWLHFSTEFFRTKMNIWNEKFNMKPFSKGCYSNDHDKILHNALIKDLIDNEVNCGKKFIEEEEKYDYSSNDYILIEEEEEEEECEEELI